MLSSPPNFWVGVRINGLLKKAVDAKKQKNGPPACAGMTCFFWAITNKKINKNRRHPRAGGDPV